MPVVLRYKDFRFFFYSNEGSPREPVLSMCAAVTAKPSSGSAPEVRVADSSGFARTLRELARVVEQNAELIERAWNERFA